MRRASALAAMILAGWALGATAVAMAGQSGVALLFARAESLYRASDLERASELFGRVIDRLESVENLQPDGQLMLVRSHVYRAIADWRLERRDGIDKRLDRIVELDPSLTLESYGAPEELSERYRKRRARKVGYLQITALPPDAEVLVDGQRIDPLPETLPVLAGEHVVSADRVGYAPSRAQVKVRSNRTEGVALQLARVSATVRIATIPPGAEVLLDGEPMGTTPPSSSDPDVSEPLLIEGLIPGSHELVVTLSNYRTFRQTVQLPALSDYDLGLLRLQPSVGTLVLRGLPANSDVQIDGQSVQLQFRAGGARKGGVQFGTGRVSLQVGSHRLLVTHPVAGVYETSFGIGDDATTGIDVAPRPGIVFLGAVGGDRLDRDAAESAVRGILGTVDAWFLLERFDAAAEVLRAAGTQPRAFSRAGDDAIARVNWTQVQAAADATAPGSLFVLARVGAGSERGQYDLFVWPAAPGLARPYRMTVRAEDTATLQALREALQDPLPAPRAWLGAVVVDSAFTGHPTLVNVQPGSPAAEAGLQVGDEILALDGQPLERASQLSAAVRAAEPLSSVVLQVGRGAPLSNVRVTLGTSPVVIDPAAAWIGPVVWAAAAVRERQADATTPAWALRIDQALVLLQAGAWDRAVQAFEQVDPPDGLPFGRAAIDYWIGVAHQQAGPGHENAALQAFQRALEPAGGRLLYHEGPLVAPRARARIATLRAAAARR